MPHVGGGSHSGGFHSGGSSSGGSGSGRTTRRRDSYGNYHSSYYKKPGFYYRTAYVPYSSVGREFNAVYSHVFMIIIGFLIMGFAFFVLNKAPSNSRLESYSLNRYEDIYDESSKDYEYNLLIEIVAYDDLKQLDYLPIVGDYIDYKVDSLFGNEESPFGSIFYDKLNEVEYKVTNLYPIIADSLKELNEANEDAKRNYYSNDNKTYKAINNTDYELGDNVELYEQLKIFTETTGYSLIVDVNYFSNVYHPNYPYFFFIFSIGLLFILFGSAFLIRKIIAVRHINQAQKDGTLAQYYEGEVNFKQQLKDHPLDKPYSYSKDKYKNTKVKESLDEYKIDD